MILPIRGKLHYLCKNFFIFKNEIAAAAKSLQSCPTLCDPIDGSPSKDINCTLSRPKSGGCAGTGGPRGATPRSRSGGAAVRRYPSSKVRSNSCALLEQP